MCNAYNHGIGCNCGFGGHQFSQGIAKEEDRLKSFTVPNAKCPVCGTMVFFYQSEHGGKVFFDSLGPPWPKHPCTDSTTIPITLETKIELNSHVWLDHGWHPLIIDNYTENSKFYFLNGRIIKCMLFKRYIKRINETVKSIKFDIKFFDGLLVEKANFDPKNELVYVKLENDEINISYYSVAKGCEVTVLAFKY